MELGPWIRNPDLPVNDLVTDNGSHYGGLGWENNGKLYVSNTTNTNNAPPRNQVWCADQLGSGVLCPWTVLNQGDFSTPQRYLVSPASPYFHFFGRTLQMLIIMKSMDIGEVRITSNKSVAKN